MQNNTELIKHYWLLNHFDTPYIHKNANSYFSVEICTNSLFTESSPTGLDIYFYNQPFNARSFPDSSGRLFFIDKGHQVEISDILVSPHLRGKGIGKKLFCIGLQLANLVFNENQNIYGFLPKDENLDARKRFWKGLGIDTETKNDRTTFTTTLKDIPNLDEGNIDWINISLFSPIRSILPKPKSHDHKNQELKKLLNEISFEEELDSHKVKSNFLSWFNKKNTLSEQRILLKNKRSYLNFVNHVYQEHHELIKTLDTLIPSAQLMQKIKAIVRSIELNHVDNSQLRNCLNTFSEAFQQEYKTITSYRLMHSSIPGGHQMNDFMLGDLDQLSWCDISKLIEEIGNEKTFKHLCRALSDTSTRRINIFNGSTNTSKFSNFIESIADRIHRVYIEQINYSEEIEIWIRLVFDDGEIRFSHNWTAWKETRATEMFENLSGIYNYFRDITYLDSQYRRKSKLKFNSKQSFVMTMLEISGYPIYSDIEISKFIDVL